MNASQPRHRKADPPEGGEDQHHSSHCDRIATARNDLAAVDALDLATASRAELALAIERLRGGYADLMRMALDHHPDA